MRRVPFGRLARSQQFIVASILKDNISSECLKYAVLLFTSDGRLNNGPLLARLPVRHKRNQVNLRQGVKSLIGDPPHDTQRTPVLKVRRVECCECGDLCVINIQLNREVIAHLDVVENVENVELNIAYNNWNCTIFFNRSERSAVHRIQCKTYRICMHMNMSPEGRVQKPITSKSRYIHVYMTHFINRSGCHGVNPYVINMVCLENSPTFCHRYLQNMYILLATLPRGEHVIMTHFYYQYEYFQASQQMNHPMYLSGCYKVTPLRHRYNCNGVTLHAYVIAIYRTCIYCRPGIAMWRSRDHDSFLFILRVLLGHTIDNSFNVFKWLPCSNPLHHQYGCHGVTSPCHRYLQ